jgi:UDP-2,3-diacylglucosamine pyrophosphatase LpxH
VICGHIHFAAMREIEGITYINCGDWVESATAVGETFDGKFELIRWMDIIEAEKAGSTNLGQTAAAA